MKIRETEQRVIIIKKTQDVGKILLGIAAIMTVVALFIVLFFAIEYANILLPALIFGSIF